jgi:hypothetical protein
VRVEEDGELRHAADGEVDLRVEEDGELRRPAVHDGAMEEVRRCRCDPTTERTGQLHLFVAKLAGRLFLLQN